MLIGEVINPTTGTGEDSMSSPRMDDVPSAAEDVQELPAPLGVGLSIAKEITDMQTTELESLSAVRAEIEEATTACEALTEHIAVMQSWAATLADRWAGTGWATKGLDSAIASITEASSALVGGEAMVEALSGASSAVTEAEALAEVAAEVGASGDVAAFAPA